MANEEQLTILKQGVEVWNEWRDKGYGLDIDLSGVDLREAKLASINLSGAKLSQAHFHRADLSRANLGGADLAEADLRDANIVGANLRGTNLRQAVFSNAVMFDTIIGNVDLSNAVGLEDVQHIGPSTISVETFALSKGKIPPAFLRGCGLSDADIEYANTLDPELSNDEINRHLYKIYDLRATQALQISPLFISYSHADGKFVDRVGAALTEKGVRYWRDIHEMKAGRIEPQIDRGIRQNPIVLLVLSAHSSQSDWVEHEVRTARELEKELERDVLCPIALDNQWKTSRWPRRIIEQIREYSVLDFSGWQEEAEFNTMFRRLIDGLELFYKG